MDGTGESLLRAPIPAWREHTNGRSRNAWRAHKKDSVAGGHRMNAQDCCGRVEMEGGAMSAKYTQVDGTGNPIQVLDAQSTLVERASQRFLLPRRLIHAASLRRRGLMYLLQRQGWERQAPVDHSLAQKRGRHRSSFAAAQAQQEAQPRKRRSRVDAILRTRRPAIPIGRAPAGLVKASKP